MRVNANQAFSLQPSPIFNLGKGFRQEAAGPALVPVATSSCVGARTDPLPPGAADPTASSGSVLTGLRSRYPRKKKSPTFAEIRSSCPSSRDPFRVALLPTKLPGPASSWGACPGNPPPPQRPRSEAPCLNMRGIFRWRQFKFAHQPYKYESPSRRDV